MPRKYTEVEKAYLHGLYETVLIIKNFFPPENKAIREEYLSLFFERTGVMLDDVGYQNFAGIAIFLSGSGLEGLRQARNLC